jgi:site-specific DNA-cytosine methylase
MPKRRLRLFDVFSGVGGFSFALQDTCKTVAYCEKDPLCATVLKANMVKGSLDHAPIIPDALEITSAQIRRLDPFIVTAGFPCQDISVMTRSEKGIVDARSGVIFHLLNAIAGTKVRVLLMENSAAIRTRGLKSLQDACRTAGFPHFCDAYTSARQVGAPHRRARWFGIAYKSESDLEVLQVTFDNEAAIKHWKHEPCVRLLRIPADIAARHLSDSRFFMMGNAVVPQCVQYAVQCIRAKVLNMPYTVLSTKQQLPTITLQFPRKTIKKQGWATPTHGVTEQCRKYTRRCSRRLTDQLFYEAGSYKNGEKPSKWANHELQMNPAWVAWIMGYPQNWTAIPKPPLSKR